MLIAPDDAEEYDPDSALTEVAAALRGADPGGERTARVLRDTFDQLYDGVRTGRYRWDQLRKTEKTHFGTQIEINMQRAFRFGQGEHLDYRIAGFDVDCKFSQSEGGWMIPPEARGELCLLLWASDTESRWKMGVVRARPGMLGGMNRDRKSTIQRKYLNEICWVFPEGRLAENTLLHLPEDDVDYIMDGISGAERVRRLCRTVQGRVLSRNVVATVAQQADYMRRLRGDDGARGDLRPEGIIILGQYERHQLIAEALGLPVPGSGDTVTARVFPALPDESPSVMIDGAFWRLADESDPVEPAPTLPSQ